MRDDDIIKIIMRTALTNEKEAKHYGMDIFKRSERKVSLVL